MIKVRSTSTQRIESKTWDLFMLRHEQQRVFFFLKNHHGYFKQIMKVTVLEANPTMMAQGFRDMTMMGKEKKTSSYQNLMSIQQITEFCSA